MNEAALDFGGIGTAEVITVLIIVALLVLFRVARGERHNAMQLIRLLAVMAVASAGAIQQWNAGRQLVAVSVLMVGMVVAAAALWWRLNR